MGDQVQSGNVSGFLNGHQRGTLAVYADRFGLRRKPVPHVGNIPDIDGCAVDGLDGNIVQAFNGAGSAVGFNLIFVAANFFGSGGENQILVRECRAPHRQARDAWPAAWRCRYRPEPAAVCRHMARDRCPVNGGEFGPQKVVGDIEELLLTEAIA